jgi:PAS domain S-box-containing protein
MERDAFSLRIEAAEKRLEALTEEQRKDSDGLWDELTAALGELQAAGKALHRQPESGREAQIANRLLRSLLDVMPVGVIVCNEDGAILMNNRGAEDILGGIVVGDVRYPKRTYTPHRLDGSPFPPGEMPLVRALEHGEVARDLEILIRRADGEERSILAGAAPVCNEAGHIISGVAVFQDITRHRQAEEAVQDLAKFPSENPNPVIRVMKDGTIHYANQGAQCLLDEWGTQAGQQLPDEWQTLVAEALGAGLARTAEISCGGRTFTFTIVPVKDSDYVNLYGTDITERVRSEQERAQAEQALKQRSAELEAAHAEAENERRRLEAVMEALPVGVAVTDALGGSLRINEAYDRVWGGPRPVAATVGDYTAYQAWWIDTGKAVAPEEWASAQAVQKGESVIGQLLEIQRFDGARASVINSASPIYDTDGNVVGSAAAIQDITNLRKAEEALQESQRDLARAQEVGQIGSWRLDVRRNVLKWSDENHRIFGVPLGTPMTYETFLGVVHPHDQQYVDTQWQAALRGEPYDIEHRIVVDGQVKWVREKAYLEFDKAGVLLGGFGITQDITERRQASEERERLVAALDYERRTLQAIMENTPTHLAYFDPQLNIILVNPAYAEGTGYTEDQLVGHDHSELFPHEENRAVFERVRDTGEPVKFIAKPFEYPDRPELGTTYWDWTLAPVKDADGRILGLVLSLVDVTEQEQARQKLRRYADRLRVLHETDQAVLAARSLDEIAESALDCVPRLLEGCTRASIALYDLEREEVSLLAVHAAGETGLGKGWHGPMGPSWVPEPDALARGEPQVIEDLQTVSAPSFVVETLQTEGIRARVTVPLVVESKLIGSLDLGLREPGRLMPGQMEVAVELADELAVSIQQARLNEQVRQHAEELENLVAQRTQALRDREARLRAIFEGAGIGIAVLDVGGRVEESNPALQELLGYSAKRLRGKLLTDFSHPDDVMADETFYKELMAQKKGVGRYRAERRYVRGDGRLCWASVTASLVREHRRKPQFVIVMMEDITEQMQAQEALIRAEKLAVTGRLAASLAHEINNPLQSVIGCLGLAQESLEVDEEEEARQLLRIAAEELERAAGIVSDLRDLNRPTSPDDRKPVDVNLQVEHILTLTREQFLKRGVEVEWEPADRLPALIVVPDRMSQVFLNLALNALEAMPDGGRLRIGTDCTSDLDWVRVTFADTGCGVAPEAIPHLFDPFYTTKTEGLGLGLYITRNVVEEHGGRIEVESLLGEGTTFTVWLPVPEDGDEGGS